MSESKRTWSWLDLLELMTQNSLLAQSSGNAKARISSAVNCFSLLLARGRKEIRRYRWIHKSERARK